MARQQSRGGGFEEFAAGLLAGDEERQREPDPMALAMQVLGMQQTQQQREREYLRDLAEQQALQKYRAGELGLREREATSAEKEREAAQKYREEAEKRDIAFKTGQTERELAKEQRELEKEKRSAEEAGKKVQSERFQKLVEEKALTPGTPLYERYLSQLDPEYGALRKQLAGEEVEAKFQGGLERYKQLTPEQRRKAGPGLAAELGGPEIYKRILAEMGPEAAPPPPAPPPPGGGGTSPLGLLMNAPGAGLRNVGRYFANIGPNVMRSLGMDVGTYPYEEFVPPSQFREAQAILGRGGSGPPVAAPVVAPPAAPRPQFGLYGPMGAPEPVPYMYGVGTRR